MTLCTTVPTPDVAKLLAPLLPALPAAAISTQPGPAVLPLLSPILRQRVQLLSSGCAEPWLRLLCYDTDKVARLGEIVRGDRLEPHPVSGEVEVDWESEADIRYRRLDRETIQALVVLEALELTFRLVYCVGDKDGGGDGWRVGEVSVTDKPAPLAAFGGHSRIDEAERNFEESREGVSAISSGSLLGVNGTRGPGGLNETRYNDGGDDNDDDDGYWARYDATPARTPATKRSPAPQSMSVFQSGAYQSTAAEEAYFAQYDSVQPALDNHDPDEAAAQAELAPPLGLGRLATDQNGCAENTELNETNGAWTVADAEVSPTDADYHHVADLQVLHPRPASVSSASSKGSHTVARLEETAEKQDQSEFGIKQHVSRNIRSLFQLCRDSGIDREEFERLVRTELDVLSMIDD